VANVPHIIQVLFTFGVFMFIEFVDGSELIQLPIFRLKSNLFMSPSISKKVTVARVFMEFEIKGIIDFRNFCVKIFNVRFRGCIHKENKLQSACEERLL